MWCQNCKMEYRDGIKVCADCGADLVDELIEIDPLAVIGTFSKEEDAKKLIEFLNYSNVDSAVMDFVEKENEWTVTVAGQDEKNAKKLYYAFYEVEKANEKNSEHNTATVESEEITYDEANGDMNNLHLENADSDNELVDTDTENADTEERLLEKTKSLRTAASTTYVKKEDQYNDLKYTGIIFLGFGIVGLVFVFLNLFKILSMLSSVLSLVVMSGMVIGFIIVGISSFKKSFEVKNQIGEETDMTNTLNEWLKANITEIFLAEIQDDTLSDEVNFFNKMEKIKELATKEYGEMDDSYLDNVVEDYYNENFESVE